MKERAQRGRKDKCVRKQKNLDGEGKRRGGGTEKRKNKKM